jgi:hypothetical protein
MTGISLHMQWPLTSQFHGSVSQREQLFVFFVAEAFKQLQLLTATFFYPMAVG